MLPRLTYDSLTLRALRLADAQGNYPNWLNDPVVCAHNSHGERTYSQAMAHAYIEQVANSETEHVFAIEIQRQHIGNIALQAISRRDESAEFAILIGEPSVYGKGVGFTAGAMLLHYGFETLNLHRIYCGTSSSNVGMQKLARKLGFVEEGKRVEAFKKNGQFLDILEYGLLQAHYKKQVYLSSKIISS